ncbi:OLC1v1012302C1 [Oldenlandia corymbosa var. corymbosa]|uniref:OLC1v1012302C1 n=1 Tax=Oldenlandia corymbosa var. corymbosa TaxID=529605 RepID=A0AAV1DVN2_OLDCO|nr:OLC1v1012302C1 [Oldenlandia corymbosa var. corymbosa]
MVDDAWNCASDLVVELRLGFPHITRHRPAVKLYFVAGDFGIFRQQKRFTASGKQNSEEHPRTPTAAPEDFCEAWDYRESQEMCVIADIWSKSDKARIKQYRDDITALESFKNYLKWTKVQQYISPIPVKDKKDDEGSSSKVSKKRKLRRLVKASEAGATSKKKKQAPPVEKEGLVEEVKPIEEDKTIEEDKPVEEGNPIEDNVSPEKDRNPEAERDPKFQKWMTAFCATMMPTGGMANVMVGISEAAIALGGHDVAVPALERMESGKPVNAGWLQQFVKPHPRITLHEAMKNGLMHLGTEQLPLFGPLCSAIPQMGSPSEITSFEGDAPMVLPAKLGEEMWVPELDRDFIGVELVFDEDFSEKVEEDKEEERESEVEKEPAGEKEVSSMQTPVKGINESQPNIPPNPNDEPYYVHNVHLMILEEDEIKHFPMYAMITSALRKFGNVHNTAIVRALEKEIVDAIQAYNVQIHSRLVQRFKQKEEEWRRRLHQYDLDFQDFLILEANISDEMKKLKDENAQLRKREKIVVSPWLLEKFELLALVEKQIEVRTKSFIAAIDLLKKRTKEAEFYLKQVAVLQNILADNKIPLPILMISIQMMKRKKGQLLRNICLESTSKIGRL